MTSCLDLAPKATAEDTKAIGKAKHIVGPSPMHSGLSPATRHRYHLGFKVVVPARIAMSNAPSVVTVDVGPKLGPNALENLGKLISRNTVHTLLVHHESDYQLSLANRVRSVLISHHFHSAIQKHLAMPDSNTLVQMASLSHDPELSATDRVLAAVFSGTLISRLTTDQKRVQIDEQVKIWARQNHLSDEVNHIVEWFAQVIPDVRKLSAELVTDPEDGTLGLRFVARTGASVAAVVDAEDRLYDRIFAIIPGVALVPFSISYDFVR